MRNGRDDKEREGGAGMSYLRPQRPSGLVNRINELVTEIGKLKYEWGVSLHEIDSLRAELSERVRELTAECESLTERVSELIAQNERLAEICTRATHGE